MNLTDNKYAKFALVKEMLETAEVVQNLNIDEITALADLIKNKQIMLTGEGSSRIFPAKNAMYMGMQNGINEILLTEGATQSLEYKLGGSSVFVASNSGKTKEGVRLIRKLKAENHNNILAVVANAGTPIIDEANGGYVLTCGNEDAVAATKSVIEQALTYDLILRKKNGLPMPDLGKLADMIEQVLTMDVDKEVTAPLVKAPIIYFAGRNNGVAEELRLKTNEITRKKSDYLEGTYAVHGIEEVMTNKEAVIVVDPFEDEEQKFKETLTDVVGISICAISGRKTSFPTMQIPTYEGFDPYIQLAAGWNLLVEIGVQVGINLDKPERARKVGNEFIG